MTGDLPAERNPRPADDRIAEIVLRVDGAGGQWAKGSNMDEGLVGRYLDFMFSVGFYTVAER